MEEKCRELFRQLNELNQQEDKAYGEADLEEHGGTATVSQELIAEKAAILNNIIRE